MNKIEQDIAYFTRRLAQARQQADVTPSQSARLAYLELARLYRKRLDALQGTALIEDGLPSDKEGHPHD